MTTVSTPDAKAAIEAMGMVMGGFMNSGRSVQVDGLGTFYYTCTSKGQGVSTADEVSAKQIAGTRVRFVPESSRKGNTIKRTLISEDLVWTNIKEISTLDGTGVTSSFTGITCGARRAKGLARAICGTSLRWTRNLKSGCRPTIRWFLSCPSTWQRATIRSASKRIWARTASCKPNRAPSSTQVLWYWNKYRFKDRYLREKGMQRCTRVDWV